MPTIKIIKIILLLSVILFAVSFFQKNKFPDKNEIAKQTYKEPIQTETNKVPFEIRKNNITYVITPLYNYELNGMIVSYNDSSNWLDYYHKKWEDFINIKDVCVIWGENIETGIYKKLKFSSGSYTCYWKTKPNITYNEWSEFKNNCISNNHLLSVNKNINKKIMDTRIGDQIHLKGYLAAYAIKGGSFNRGTSVSRTDAGNGACEVIYLTDFQIIKKANPFWNSAIYITKYLITICLIILTILFFKEL